MESSYAQQVNEISHLKFENERLTNQISQLKDQVSNLLKIQSEQEITIKEGYKSICDESPGSNPKDCLDKVVQMSQSMALILRTQQKSLNGSNEL